VDPFYSHKPTDEPLAVGAPTDYRYLLDVLMRKREDERDRLDRLESKIAVVVAGTIAALGFSIEKAGSPLDGIAAALFVVPLAVLLCALLPVTYAEAPSAADMCEKFPRYPLQSMKAACHAIANGLEENEPKLRNKVKGLRWGIVLLLGVTFFIVGVHCAESFSAGSRGSHAGRQTGQSSATAPATASTTHTGLDDHIHRKGR
jgi:hypothetical protein